MTVPVDPGTPVRALSIHADYACRQSGACCTSGWVIPVEAPAHHRLSTAIASGRLHHPRGDGPAAFDQLDGLPPDAVAVLGLTPRGTCAFFDGAPGNTCAIHRQVGHDALPAACRHFPRVCLLDARGVSVTLSHYCPTAARSLFRGNVTLAIDHTPPAFPASTDYEGFDARDTWPPLLRPGLLADLETSTHWEEQLVRLCARDDLDAEGVLWHLERFTEVLRIWKPASATTLATHTSLAAEATIPAAGAGAPEPFRALMRRAAPGLARLVTGSIPATFSRPDLPDGFAVLDRRWVRPVWATHAAPVRRYLAARGFASWLAYQGSGLRTVLAGVATALGVLRVEAARLAGHQQRLLDEALLIEAFRAADLQLVHLASPEDLAEHLAPAEDEPLDAWLSRRALSGFPSTR